MRQPGRAQNRVATCHERDLSEHLGQEAHVHRPDLPLVFGGLDQLDEPVEIALHDPLPPREPDRFIASTSA
jgi:hypothetical protein